jgi:hypothetical protein
VDDELAVMRDEFPGFPVRRMADAGILEAGVIASGMPGGRMAAPARVYDAWLSGKDNLAADRDAAGSVTALLPSIIETVRENRAFARRAVCYLAGWQGISQFIDIGCGLPAEPAARETAVHDIAQRITPDARVLYCDNDPEVMAHARALWTSSHDGQVSYLEADVRDPGHILAQAARVIDLSCPVAVMLCAVLHFVGCQAAFPVRT